MRIMKKKNLSDMTASYRCTAAAAAPTSAKVVHHIIFTYAKGISYQTA